MVSYNPQYPFLLAFAGATRHSSLEGSNDSRRRVHLCRQYDWKERRIAINKQAFENEDAVKGLEHACSMLKELTARHKSYRGHGKRVSDEISTARVLTQVGGD